MKLENFLKHKVTSIVGVIMMITSAYVMLFKNFSVWPEGCVIFALGFMMLYMRDSIPGFITKIFEKKIKE
jgi:predicted Na+-dependent transporter